MQLHAHVMQKTLQDYMPTVLPVNLHPESFAFHAAGTRARASMAGCLHAHTSDKPSERAASPGLRHAPAKQRAAQHLSADAEGGPRRAPPGAGARARRRALPAAHPRL
jgi:hypothetical protein